MARGISEFKSKLTQGGARPNLFMVRLNFPNELSSVIDFGTIDANSATEKAQFLVKTAQIPASTIGSIDVPFRGRMLKVAGDRTFEPWSVTVLNDGEFTIRKAFEAWSRGINALTENVSQLGYGDGGQGYTVDLEVFQLSRDGKKPDKTPPNITAAAAGFEKGLEDVEAKSVVPQDTAATSDAASLAADTNLIDKKLGFEQKLPIGTVRELDSAIAAVFNLENVQIRADGIVFPEAYRLRALAIKDIASDLAQSGKYDTLSGVDVSTLVADAAALKEQKYFSSLPKAFGNYSVKSGIGEAVNATADYSITTDNQATLGNNFATMFNKFADNPDTPLVEELTANDLILKQDIITKSSRAKNIQVAGAKFVMTDNAYNAIENFIQSMESTALQKAYIQYLPKNLNIFVKDNAIPIQDRLNATFGFTTF